MKHKFVKDTNVVEKIIPRGKIAIWFKWMFYSKLVLSIVIAIFLPQYVILYYKSFLLDVFALMYIHSYANGDIKNLIGWYKGIKAKGKLKRMQ